LSSFWLPSAASPLRVLLSALPPYLGDLDVRYSSPFSSPFKPS
jgi:hypothetical protein